MKPALMIASVMLAACSTPSPAVQPGADHNAFCDPVVAAYERIDQTDIATVRAVVVAISEGATELDEINRATLVAYGAELQVTLTGGVWSTAKLATELNSLCGTDLTVWASP